MTGDEGMQMRLMPLQPVVVEQCLMAGQVTVHPTAVIAKGVLLQAENGAQICVEEGVCLGMGTIIHAVGGGLVVKKSASLGPGVLVVGNGYIGQGACVGAQATIFFHSVETRQVIPPGTIIGDFGDQNVDEHMENSKLYKHNVYGKEYVEQLIANMRAN